ncbi:MAG: hypothetical protein HQK97_12750 [Nitrospirae bacterium]|nr:hypothetical protein [Nitrospirota bacterium]
MDLGHITTVFPIVMTMAAFIAIDTVIKDRVLLKRFVIGAAVGAVYAIFDVCITKSIETRTVELFILNIGSGVFITLIVLTDCDGLRFTFPKLAKNPAALLIFSTAAIAAGFYFGPRRLAVVDYICIAPVLVAAAAGLCTILIYAPRSRVKVMLILALVLLCCLRVTRFFGEESVPYISVFPEISIMDRLRQEQADNPLRPFRIASLDFVYIPMVQNKVFETPDGRGPLFNKYYRQFIGILRAPQLEDFVVRHDFNTNWYNLFISDGFAGFYLYPYAFLNNKYFVITTDKSGSSPNDDFEVVYAGTTADDYTGIWKKLIDLYRRPISVIKCNASFERWYLVKQTSIVKSDEDIADAILKSEGEGLLNTVYYSKADMPQELNGQLTANDKIIATYYSPDEIQLDVEVTSPAALVVSNNYDPRWRASVDGQDTAVLRANLAFQSIEIKTAGRHSVVLRYEDKPQRLTLIFIPVGILIFNFFIIYGGAMTKSHS